MKTFLSKSAVKRASRSAKWGKRSYSQQQVLQNVEYYNAVIQSGLESASLSRVEHTLKEMKEKGLKPNSATRCLLIDFAQQQNNLTSALEQFEELSKTKEALSNAASLSLLKTLSNTKETSKALGVLPKIFSSLKAPSFKHYQLAIQIYCNAGDLDSATSLYQKMKKENLYINSPIYASLMKAASAKKEVNATVSFWKEMNQKGLSPNLHHFDSLLFLYDSLNNAEGIKNTLQELRQNYIAPQGVSEAESFTVSYVKKLLTQNKRSGSTTTTATPSSASASTTAQASQTPNQAPSSKTSQASSSSRSSKETQSDSEKKKTKKTK